MGHSRKVTYRVQNEHWPFGARYHISAAPSPPLTLRHGADFARGGPACLEQTTSVSFFPHKEPVLSTLYGPRFLTGTVGGSVTHQCFYSITPTNKHDRKYWCKRASDGICYTIVSTTGYVSKGHAGRVSLEDIPENGTFMVTMTQLESSDTGTYRCGIGSTNRDLYVSLNLTVSEGKAAGMGRGGPVPRGSMCCCGTQRCGTKFFCPLLFSTQGQKPPGVTASSC